MKSCKGAVCVVEDSQVYGNDNTHDLHLHEALEEQVLN